MFKISSSISLEYINNLPIVKSLSVGTLETVDLGSEYATITDDGNGNYQLDIGFPLSVSVGGATGFRATSTSGVTIPLSTNGTNVWMENIIHNTTCDVTTDSDGFIILESGTYSISYFVKLAKADYVGAELFLDGVAIPGSKDYPGPALDHYSSCVQLHIDKGQEVNLKLYGTWGEALLADNGACVIILQVDD